MKSKKIVISSFKMIAMNLILLLLIGACQEQRQTPNVVIFLADDLGYSDISIYREQINNPDKSSTAITSNVDELAREGMRMTAFYCGAAVCSPSRSAIITGRNATRLGIYNWIPPSDNPMNLRDEEWTIAEMLRHSGYRTGHFGKWHLTSEGMGQPLPMDQGFDHAFYTFNNAIPSHHNPENFHRNGEPVGTLKGYSCHLVVDEAIRWLDGRDDQKPFFTNIWFNEPHEKVAAPDSLVNRHEYNEVYYGAIENMDHAIGRFVRYLEDRGLAENTIFIFTSDNGSQVKGSVGVFRGAKAFNYEGGLRVPFVIRWDGHVMKSTVSEIPGSFVDVLPSLAGLLKIDPGNKKALDGEDMSSVFLGKKCFIRSSPIFFYRYFHEPIAMLREDQWVLLGYEKQLPYQHRYNTREQAKLKPSPDEPQWSMWGFQKSHMKFIDTLGIHHYELYDILQDPEQKNDLSEQYPEVADKMQTKMATLKKEMIEEGGNWYD